MSLFRNGRLVGTFKVTIATKLTLRNMVMETASGSTPLLPPKPEEPLDSDCCGTGCTPCVFDIFKKNLKRWDETCSKIRHGEDITRNESLLYNSHTLSPYEYGNYKVTAVTDDCSSCKILRFQTSCENFDTCNPTPFRNSDVAFPVKLGQHVVVKISDKSKQYTVLDVGNDGSFQILFKIYESGQFTPWIDRLTSDSVVQMRGPFGQEFSYEANLYNSLVMFAAGSGIAPFCRIIERVLRNDEDESTILLCYSCRNEEEVMILKRVKDWSRHWNFRVNYFMSKPRDAGKARSLHYGVPINCQRIDKDVICDIVSKTCDDRSKNVMFMICGTKSFEKDIVNHLKFAGIQEDKIKMF